MESKWRQGWVSAQKSKGVPWGLGVVSSLGPQEQEAWWEAPWPTVASSSLQAPARQAQSLQLNKHLMEVTASLGRGVGGRAGG